MSKASEITCDRTFMDGPRCDKKATGHIILDGYYGEKPYIAMVCTDCLEEGLDFNGDDETD